MSDLERNIIIEILESNYFRNMKVLLIFKKAYYRLFYFFFRFGEIVDTKSPYPDTDLKFACVIGIMIMSMVVSVDVFTIFWVISRFVVKLPIVSPFVFAFAIILVFILNMTLYFRKKRYVRIVEHFRCESENIKGFRTFLCVIFTLASLFTISILGFQYGNP